MYGIMKVIGTEPNYLYQFYSDAGFELISEISLCNNPLWKDLLNFWFLKCRANFLRSLHNNFVENEIIFAL